MSVLRPFYFMVKYTAEREWIEGKGLWLWLAFCLGGMGVGLYLVSLYLFHDVVGMTVGWFIVLAKAICHLVYLGKPQRFLRAFAKPGTSWISRGVLFITVFLILGAIQIAGKTSWFPVNFESTFLTALVTIFGFLLSLYPGFVMTVVNAIAFWNNSLLPILYVLYAILGGFGLALGLAVIRGAETMIPPLETGIGISLPVAAIALAIYLAGSTSTPAGKVSVAELIKGRFSFIFYWAVVIVGIFVPLMISIYNFSVSQSAAAPVLGIGVVCEIIGSLAVRYCVFRAGFYSPLIPTNNPYLTPGTSINL